MSKDAFDNELDDYLDGQDEAFTCSECGKKMKKDNGVCSQKCHETSMR